MRLCVLHAFALLSVLGVSYLDRAATTPRYLLNLTASGAELADKARRRGGAVEQFGGDLEQLLCPSVRCAANAYCSAPDLCECRVGYVRIGGVCRSICGEAYAWNEASDRCESRCRQPGVVWDGETRSCVQRLTGQVELIAAEVDILLPPALDDDQTEGGGDGEGEPRSTAPVGEAGEACLPQDEDCLNLAADLLTNSTDDGDDPSTWPNWMSVPGLLTGLGVISLLVSLGAGARYLWWRHQQKPIAMVEVFDPAAKIDFCTEYELDRSQIMVY